MTPEQRAAAVLDVKRTPDGNIDWDIMDSGVLPQKLESLIAASIRAAVAEERESVLRTLEMCHREHMPTKEQAVGMMKAILTIRARGDQ
jgi:hypothetical protein